MSSFDDYIERLEEGDVVLTLHDARDALIRIMHRANGIDEAGANDDPTGEDYDLLWDAIRDEIGEIWNDRGTSQVTAIDAGPVEEDPKQALAACIRLLVTFAQRTEEGHVDQHNAKEARELITRIESSYSAPPAHC